MGCSSRLAGRSLRPALQSVSVCLSVSRGFSTHSDTQTSCGSLKLPTNRLHFNVAVHRGFSHCLAPQSRPLGALSGRPGLGGSSRPGLSLSLSLPPQDPTSRPPPASCPPAPRGLSSLFLRAALPPAAGSRRHCLEPPVRRRGQGGLGGRGPPRHWSSPLSLPAASRSDLSLMPPTRLGLGAVFVIPKLGGQKIPGGAT